MKASHQPPATSDRSKEAENELVLSYMTLRNLIGFFGMLLPLVLAFTTSRIGDDRILEPSISDYYYTANGDVLVVLLSILSVFLMTYQGYNWKEKGLTFAAAICGLGVAFSPTVSKYTRSAFSVHTLRDEVPVFLGLEKHLFFAACFFILLSIICLVYFPMTDRKSKERKGKRTAKDKRNLVYLWCGWTMVASVVVLALYFFITPFHRYVGDFPIIFVLEAVAIEAFGISWITKGETLWPDGEHYLVRALRKVRQRIAVNASAEMARS